MSMEPVRVDDPGMLVDRIHQAVSQIREQRDGPVVLCCGNEFTAAEVRNILREAQLGDDITVKVAPELKSHDMPEIIRDEMPQLPADMFRSPRREPKHNGMVMRLKRKGSKGKP